MSKWSESNQFYLPSAAESFEFGVDDPILSFANGEHVSKWIDGRRKIWCYVAHDSDGDWHFGMTLREYGQALADHKWERSQKTEDAGKVEIQHWQER